MGTVIAWISKFKISNLFLDGHYLKRINKLQSSRQIFFQFINSPRVPLALLRPVFHGVVVKHLCFSCVLTPTGATAVV